jgi:protein gp37
MNKTKIDWADMTWNPVTGCKHGCEYCYARKIAERFGGFRQIGEVRGPNVDLEEKYVAQNGKVNPFPYGFTPTIHRYRLNEPASIKTPQTIFVCSMADLFGEWVPDEWIQEVFKACDAAPQHRYLFLTKNPKRYEQVLDRYFPPNMWFGWSQDGPMGDALKHSTHHSIQSFVSIEPLRRPFESFNVRGLDWAIVGAETGNRKGKVIPEKSWVDSIAVACAENGVPLFMKESLRGIMGDDFIQGIPW